MESVYFLYNYSSLTSFAYIGYIYLFIYLFIYKAKLTFGLVLFTQVAFPHNTEDTARPYQCWGDLHGVQCPFYCQNLNQTTQVQDLGLLEGGGGRR
jgi:hypothetical protein